MFRVVLTVAIVLHFILISCSVDGSTVRERQNCPFPGKHWFISVTLHDETVICVDQNELGGLYACMYHVYGLVCMIPVCTYCSL